jgi:Holliday junction DNA helicase RuvA
MIARIRGTLAEIGPDYVIVDVGGVGYELAVPSTTVGRLPSRGEEVTLGTYLHVREDALQLFGFAEPADKELFELLISVSGVGPKVALAVLSAFPADDLRKAIATEDVALISSVPGIGKKTAQRLVLELKEKIAGAAEIAGAVIVGVSQTTYVEARDALTALGYSPVEAKKALEGYDGDGREPTAEELVKHGLKSLG